MFKFKLGSTVTSLISGFSGIVTSRAEHLNGCNRYWVAPKVDKDGKLPDGLWMDENELEVVSSKNIKTEGVKTGGFPNKLK